MISIVLALDSAGPAGRIGPGRSTGVLLAAQAGFGETGDSHHIQGSGTPAPSLPTFMWLQHLTVVRHAFDDAARGRVVSIPGVQFRLLSAVASTLPRPFVRRILAAMATWRHPRHITKHRHEGVRP